MDELGLDPAEVKKWFQQQFTETCELVSLSEEAAASLSAILPVPVRRCYISDALLETRATALGLRRDEVINAALPDPGAVMAGDFGEIIVFIYHGARNAPLAVSGPKKWRLKQDRTKPCPHSDVVQFILPNWPDPSAEDQLLCSEVKCKSTPGAFRPVLRAIEGCMEDRTSRLAKTLVWLRDRAILTDAAGSDIAVLNRFIQADSHPPARKRFEAVAVVCTRFLGEALEDVPSPRDPAYDVVIMTVPDLHTRYNEVFAAVAGTGATIEPAEVIAT